MENQRVELYGNRLNADQKIIILHILKNMGDDRVLDTTVFGILKATGIHGIKNLTNLLKGIMNQIIILHQDDEECHTLWFEDFVFSRDYNVLKIQLSNDLVPPYTRMAWQALLSQH